MAIHSCDTPSCVNPDHLREGSRADNAQDMVDRGRQAHQYGVLNGEAKLTEADVVAIRASAGAISQSELGKRYNVSQGLVAMIIARKAWRHIPAAENDRSSVRVPHVGALNGKAKLTEADVVAIRALTGVPQREIARRYGVGSTAIVKIIGRKTWRHI
jgi:DNA-binding transcriptional regulator YiaG